MTGERPYLAPLMITISDITGALEHWAAPALQEGYDNAGLLTGQPQWACTGALCTLDVTVAVVQEARNRAK